MLVFEPQMVKVCEIGLFGGNFFMKMLEKSYSNVTVYTMLIYDIVEQGIPILYT